MYVITLILLLRHLSQFMTIAFRSIPMLVLMGLPFLSVLWSISSSITLRRSVALLMSTLLAYLIAMRFTPRQQTLLFAIVLTGVMVLSLLMAAGAPHMAFAPGETALRGLFAHKNVFGWFSSISVLLGVALIQDPWLKMRRVGWFSAILGFTCVLLSQSATSLLVAVASIVFFMAFRLIERSKGLGRVVLILLTLQVIAIILVLLAVYLLPLLEALGKDATLTGRVPLWALVDPEIAKRPLLGYGYGAFWSEANGVAYSIYSESGWSPPHAHSGFRDLLLSVGFVGVAVLVFVVVQSLIRGLTLQFARPDDGWTWCNLMIAFSLIVNLSESTFLMQNDLIWTMTATAILTINFHYPSFRPKLSRHQRLAMAAA
jgi:exopolysaccharide production protein ExoQ